MHAFLIQYGYLLAIAAYSFGALFSILLSSPKHAKTASVVAHVWAGIGASIGLLFAGAVLISGTSATIYSSVTLGIVPGILTISIDLFSAFFVGLISLVALATSIYGIGYQSQYAGTYSLARFGFFYNIFLASMVVVVLAQHALLFLFAWEIMAIASYFLVIFEHRNNSNLRAGFLYLLITQCGTACLFIAFLLLFMVSGSWDFTTIRESVGAMSPVIQNIILALALVGFGSKAGLIPLHIWLPEAHPAAPSHVSALMSGVMLKTAIFMVIRFFIDFFPTIHPFWGFGLVLLGAISSVLGVLYAIAENDLKRLLAFSSVENIGIITMGIGTSLTFFAYGNPILGTMVLSASLYHCINHALFKGLLFLAAGSVVHQTHSRNMEKLGGLIKGMPATALFFLIGAIAITGIPPLNGFVSEWFTFQGLFAGIGTLPHAGKIVFLIGASALAFTGGLAVACFVKAFGITFLARPRSEVSSHVKESGMTMQIGMGILAIGTVFFGLGASVIMPALTQVAMSIQGFHTAITLTSPLATIGLGIFSSLNMLWVASAVLAGICISYFTTWIFAWRRKVVIDRTWNCGAPMTSRMEISSTGFSRSIVRVFSGLLRPSMQTEIEYHDSAIRYFARGASVRFSLHDVYRRYLYAPLAYIALRGGKHTTRIQTGNLNGYILYVTVTLIVLLLWTLK